MPKVIELCRGTGCTMAPYCDDYRLRTPQKGIAFKERIPTLPGERCPDYSPRQKPRWNGAGLDFEAEYLTNAAGALS